MTKYICEKCNKEFERKSSYTSHINRKKTCIEKISVNETPIYDNINGNITKPFLKWVGGKTQILDKLLLEFPTEINNYREIFLGGGSVLFAILNSIKNNNIKAHGKIYAYDLNEPLIYTYKNIQNDYIVLYNEIQNIIREFNQCKDEGEINRKPKNFEEAKTSKESYYYWIRQKYNSLNKDEKKTFIGSALFIFLNKTCFRGVFRIGPNGFNVPYGHYKNPEIVNKQHLETIHNLIKDVVFQCCDFSTSLKEVEQNDYVYMDPPYAPETNTSFVGYTENGFNLDSHVNLFNTIHKLSEKNVKLMLSNSDVELVRENFINENGCSSRPKYNISSILCKRSINSKNPESKTREVIIKNY
jgi:DNA adenine methylase